MPNSDYLVRDRLWGDFIVDDPLLLDLMQSAPVQRLRNIHQAGASYYIMPEQRSITRFEHSLGVMHLLDLIGAPLEEQAAGLLHDVPHTAFSHTADIIFPNDEHNFHERHHSRVIDGSEIPHILARYGISQATALEPDRFPLLERPLPALCADRIDYSLRDSVALGHSTPEEAGRFLMDLVTTEVGVAVRSVEWASWFGAMFLHVNDEVYTSVNDAGAYWALAGAIMRAYTLGEFTDADLFSTDNLAMSKLRASVDPLIGAYLKLLQPGTVFRRASPEGPHFTAHMKQRSVDPPVMLPGRDVPVPLSELSPVYAEELRRRQRSGNTLYSLWSDAMPPALAASLSEPEHRRP